MPNEVIQKQMIIGFEDLKDTLINILKLSSQWEIDSKNVNFIVNVFQNLLKNAENQ